MMHDIERQIIERYGELRKPEHMLNTGLFTKADYLSGSRSALLSMHLTQWCDPVNPEVPAVSFGHEHLFGVYSDNYTKTKNTTRLIHKIYKFEYTDECYEAIVYDTVTKKYDIISRRPYVSMAEVFGYAMNNEELDKLEPGDYSKPNTMLTRASSIDKHGNFMYGVNARIVYTIQQGVLEDPVEISESFARRAGINLIQEIYVPINTNDIPLALFEDDKTFPDVGESMQKGVLMGLRRDTVATRQHNRDELLRVIQSNDQIYQRHGNYTVVDIDIMCNAKYEDIPDTRIYSQIKDHQRQNINYHQELFDVLSDIKEKCKNSDESYTDRLGLALAKARDFLDPGCAILDNGNFFDNMIIKFTIRKKEILRRGYKITGRAGNKSIISRILPDNMMYRTADGRVADIHMGGLSVLGRLNLSQCYTGELGWISEICKERMRSANSIGEQWDILHQLLSLTNVMLMEETMKHWESLDMDGKYAFINEILKDRIYLMDRPINGLTGENMKEIYDTLDIHPEIMYIDDEEGNTQQTLRPMIMNLDYMMILKHITLNKASARSKGKTNPRNNSPIKSTEFSNGKRVISDQSSRFGEQEMLALGLINDPDAIDYLVRSYSTSVDVRQDESILYKNPLEPMIFEVGDAKNRIVGECNALSRSAGYNLTPVMEPNPDYQQDLLEHPVPCYMKDWFNNE